MHFNNPFAQAHSWQLLWTWSRHSLRPLSFYSRGALHHGPLFVIACSCACNGQFVCLQWPVCHVITSMKRCSSCVGVFLFYSGSADLPIRITAFSVSVLKRFVSHPSLSDAHWLTLCMVGVVVVLPAFHLHVTHRKCQHCRSGVVWGAPLTELVRLQAKNSICLLTQLF